MKMLSITALMLAPANPALAEPSVEVMHFWTSGGEAAALGAIRDRVVAEGVTDPDRIRALLVEQITHSVRWRESVAWMAGQGVTDFWEIGAGKALSGMVRRIAKDAETRALLSPDDVAAAAAGVGT